MNAKENSQFQKALAKLRYKYPECMIDAWTPTDYQEVTGRKLTKDDNLNIADTLYERFDATVGVNWDSIGFVITELGLHEDIENES